MLEVKVTVSMPEVSEAINNLAAALSNKPTAPKAQPAPAPVASQPQQTPAPAPAPVMNAGAALMDAGKIEDLMNLLHSFGVQAVMELKPEQLGAFATEMRKLGAAI